ncbi:catalase family peroxidase [Pseudomonas sp. 5P_3.1_Bac2]|uniref:catalase family peroxidase n=1 Tax=Pseudomonas sp. 5P_3.1_Bac2 TaxID=2971617 RepID=UPI0021CA6E4F|nr:catalase family peroxidase [Pseudomonas sp. 5P_3.1_Bac2]MCU1717488.1 catalase family peroxidase [Pseudomonas sp. 5P_3.1_Bac2]
MVAIAGPSLAGNESESLGKTVIQQDQLYDALLDALYATFGQHPGFRVAHAKGLLVAGTFTASAAARGLTTAAHLQGDTVPVVLRFSNFSGLPSTVDGDPMASPHGLAIRFTLPDGGATDIVSHSFNGFPVATPQDFLTFLQGIAASSVEPANPAPLQAFLATHPRAQAFLDTPKPAPRSYVGAEYFGVNALLFTNQQGQQQAGRYRIEPLRAEPALSDKQAAQMPDDYLQTELAERLAKGPLQLRLVLQLAVPGDNLADGSIAWSRSHPEVELGLFTLKSLIPAEQQQAQQQGLDFNPGRLVEGISPSSDPMILARQRIYERALQRRNPQH